MKKLMTCFLCVILVIYGGTAKAAGSPALSLDVKGSIETGQTIQILINIDNIDSLYAGAASLKYDPKVLKIISFEKGDLIIKSGVNIFDVGNKIDNASGIASFGGFSCVGQSNGFSGSGTFLKINAQVLKKDSFNIKSKPFLDSPSDDYNLKIQLCDKSIKLVNYEFKDYEFKAEEVKPENPISPVITPETKDDTKTSTDSQAGSEVKQGSTVVNSNINSNTQAIINSLVNNDTKKESSFLNPNINSDTKSDTNSLVNNYGESDQGSNLVSSDINSNTKSIIDSLISNKNKVDQIGTTVSSDTSTNVKVPVSSAINNSKQDKTASNDVVEINEIKSEVSGNQGSSNKTIKDDGWQKVILIMGALVLAVAVVGGIYIYRKRYQKQGKQL